MFQSLKRHVPQFNSWLDVERRYRQTQHCRTDAPMVRRLCDDGSDSYGRRNKNLLLIRVHGGTKPSEDCFEVSYYNTVIARFYRKYYTINLEGWNSKSTKIILEQLTGATIKNFHPLRYIPDTYPCLEVRMHDDADYHQTQERLLIPDITLTRDKLGTLAEANAPSTHCKDIPVKEQEVSKYTEIKFPVDDYWVDEEDKLVATRAISTVDKENHVMGLCDWHVMHIEPHEEAHTMRIPVRPVSCAELVWFPKGVTPRLPTRGSNTFNNPEAGYLFTSRETYKFDYDGSPITRRNFCKFYKYKIDKKELNKTRKNIQRFLDYIKAYMKLCSKDGGDTVIINKDAPKYMGGLQQHEMFALLYWYCLKDKPKTVREFFNSTEEGTLWADMLTALQQSNKRHALGMNNNQLSISCASVIEDLDRIIKHANPRTLVRVS